ncbi:NUDIX hydrolase domain-like protein [Dipodascopsis tothii]|uniref:NUDIX hydrolase domain-like protein n=1 Tax=Dipodascopsis tothii TaxID=44089 RepID=UPI0034CFAE57
MFSNLQLIALTDSVPYAKDGAAHASFFETVYAFRTHDGVATLGYVQSFVVDALRDEPDKFAVDDAARTVAFLPSYDTYEKRNKMVANLTQAWRTAGRFKVLSGWRNELYRIYYPARQTYLLMERAATPLFGIVSYGVHLVAYVPATESQPLRLWVPRRSKTKSTYPGMLDNTVAGGIGDPYGVFETLIKECGEEAGFPEALVRAHAQSVGVVSYFYERTAAAGGEAGCLQPEVQYCYDLALPADAPSPTPVDGEVDEFYLLDVDAVKRELAAGSFKPNTALVTIDFLVRHGYITAESEPDYIEILARMHRQLEFPLA